MYKDVADDTQDGFKESMREGNLFCLAQEKELMKLSF